MFDHGFPPYWSTLKKLIWLVGTGIAGGAKWITLTGSIVSFVANKVASILGLTVTITPQQDLSHGDPSPENECPITGWTGASVTRTGKNLYNKGVSSGITIISDLLKVGKTYTVTAKRVDSGISSYLYLYKSINPDLSDGTLVGYVIAGTNEYARTFTVENGYYYGLWNGNDWNNVKNIQLEVGSTATDYEAFNGTTVSVTFPALGKNLLKTNGLTYGTPSSTAYSNATKRTFLKDTYVVGLTVGNYYQGNRTTDITVSENFVQFTTNASAYGVSIPVVGLEVGKRYKLNATAVNGRLGAGYYKQDGTFISSVSAGANPTLDIPAETYYTLINFSASTVDEVSTFTDIQLEQNSSSTEYEPYTNTVFGGEYEVVSGEVKPYKEYDSYNGETLTGRWMSSIDKYVSGTTPTIGAQVVDLESFDTTIEVTAQPISTLEGQNNIWSDAGNVAVTVPQNIIVE